MEGSPREVMFHALDALAKGWSVQELVLAEEGGRLALRAVRPKDPAAFGLRLDPFGALVGLTLRDPEGRERPVPRERFALFRHRATYDAPKGRSDLEACYRDWMAKNALLDAWRLHLERFASPTVLGRYQRGLPDAERDRMLEALRSLADTTAVVFPSEIEIDTLGGDRQASSTFLDAIEFHNREIARAILGQTLTTDEGRRVGSLALGRVHLQVLLLQIEALRRELAGPFFTEQIVRPLVEWNFGPGPVPRLEFESAGPSAFVTGRI